MNQPRSLSSPQVGSHIRMHQQTGIVKHTDIRNTFRCFLLATEENKDLWTMPPVTDSAKPPMATPERPLKSASLGYKVAKRSFLARKQYFSI